jgi:hypothetical protein
VGEIQATIQDGSSEPGCSRDQEQSCPTATTPTARATRVVRSNFAGRVMPNSAQNSMPNNSTSFFTKGVENRHSTPEDIYLVIEVADATRNYDSGDKVLPFNRSFSLPKSDCFQAARFGGLILTESWSFSSEKSYSPSRLICCQDTTEPFAMAWNRISRAFRSPDALSSDGTVWVQGRFE